MIGKYEVVYLVSELRILRSHQVMMNSVVVP